MQSDERDNYTIAAQSNSRRAERLASCSDDPGRISRSFLTPAVHDAHLQLTSWMQEAGMSVRPGATNAIPGDVTCTVDCRHGNGPSAPRLVSGAGHDAMIMAGFCPSTMLFVRSPGGISHHPDETVRSDDVAEAVRVLVRLARSFGTTGEPTRHGDPDTSGGER